MKIVKAHKTYEKVMRSINWLSDRITIYATEATLKKVILHVLFITTSKYINHLTVEQYEILIASVDFCRTWGHKEWPEESNMYTESLLDFAETVSKRGLADRLRAEANTEVSGQTLEEIRESPSEFGPKILRAADDIVETDKEVFVLKKLLRERKAVLKIHHSKLRLMLVKRAEGG